MNSADLVQCTFRLFHPVNISAKLYQLLHNVLVAALDILYILYPVSYTHLTGIVLLGICFCLFISKLIDMVLKRFYRVVSAIESIQSENLSVEIPETGNDEIGILASSIRRMTERIQVLVSESVQRERLIKDSEIRALQNQINTHFIYNVLESIKMMAEIDEKYDISDAVTSLGKLLRYSMKWSSPLVTVGDELEYIRNYISLMRLRYD